MVKIIMIVIIMIMIAIVRIIKHSNLSIIYDYLCKSNATEGQDRNLEVHHRKEHRQKHSSFYGRFPVIKWLYFVPSSNHLTKTVNAGLFCNVLVVHMVKM